MKVCFMDYKRTFTLLLSCIETVIDKSNVSYTAQLGDPSFTLRRVSLSCAVKLTYTELIVQ